MYKSGYVVTIRHDGWTLKEDAGKITIPFDSEYEIRLRNKTRKRAVADVYIDGDAAAEGIVVNANDSIDLERYVKNTGHALLKGARFKFVPLGDSRVEDKGEPENGRLEVRWYPEKEPKPWTPPPVPQIIEIHEHCHGGYHYCNCHQCHPIIFGNTGTDYILCNGGGGTQSKGSSMGNLTIGDSIPDSNITLTGGMESLDVSHDGVAANLAMDAGAADVFSSQLKADIAKADEAGATVEGSESRQTFTEIHVDVDRENATILTLHLVGVRVLEPVEPETRLIRECDDKPRPSKSKGKLAAYCSTCGRQRRTGENFCPADGMRFQ